MKAFNGAAVMRILQNIRMRPEKQRCRESCEEDVQ